MVWASLQYLMVFGPSGEFKLAGRAMLAQRRSGVALERCSRQASARICDEDQHPPITP